MRHNSNTSQANSQTKAKVKSKSKPKPKLKPKTETQISFPSLEPKDTGSRGKKREHGGSRSRGKRKTRRPLTTRQSLHVVLKSQRAKGRRALIRHARYIRTRIQTAARKFNVRVYGKAIHFNHIHLQVRGTTLIGLQNFFRVVAGHIAQHVLRELPLGKDEIKSVVSTQRRFWEDLLYSRIVSWGREFKRVQAYIGKNIRQVEEELGPVAAAASTINTG
jgi:REP element-mobilizing transposase RayT